MSEFHKGSLPRLSAAFKDAAGTLGDPSTVTVKYQKPDGTEVTKVYVTDVEVVKDSVGNYHIDVSASASGVWVYRWQSTGPVTAAEAIFTVKESEF